MYTRGTPKMKFIYKNCVFILTCLNFSHLQSTFHLTQYTYWDIFPTAPNSFWTCGFWCLSRASAIFCFHLSHNPSRKMFPFVDFFIWGNKNNVAQSATGRIGRMRHGGHAIFGWKLLNTQHGVAGAFVNHPSGNGQMPWKSFKKRFTEAKHRLSQQYQLEHGYRWVPRTLT